MVCQPLPERLVIFSTHIPADVEQVAQQVIVLQSGQVRYAGGVDGLRQLAQGMVWEICLPDEQAAPILSSSPASRIIDQGDFTRLRTVGYPPSNLPIQEVEPTLEDAYLLMVNHTRKQNSSTQNDD
jgi:ABC-2 type transport system ATP-binding protein